MEASSLNTSVFLCSPSSGAPAHDEYWSGCLDAVRSLGSLVEGPAVAVGPLVMENRNVLAAQCIRGGWSHMLCVDRDIGWRAVHLRRLLDADKDVVSGMYCRKRDGAAALPVFAEDGKTEGQLRECTRLPGGFLLIKLSALLRVTAEHTEHMYSAPGLGAVAPLWDVISRPRGERILDDWAFSERCRAAGIELWAHTGVVLIHYGVKGFVPPQNQVGASHDTADSGAARLRAVT